MRISLRQLEVLETFARTKSATETAALMNVSQSAVSQILKEIEAHFAFKLFYRKGSQIHLTPEVLMVLPDVERILKDVSRLENQVGLVQGADGGAISVAGMSTLVAAVLPKTIARFGQQRPEVRFKLEWLSTWDMLRQIREETIDVAVTLDPGAEPGVLVEPIWRVPMVCVSQKGHRFGALTSLTFDDLVTERVISSTTGTPSGALMRERFDQAALRHASMVETNLSAATINLVRNGAGVGLIHPLDFADSEIGSLNLTPLEPSLDLTVTMLFSRARPRSPLLSGFCDAIRETIAGYAEAIRRAGIPSTTF